MRTAAILSLISLLIFNTNPKNFAGPYEVVFRNLFLCNTTVIDTFSTKVRKINRTHSSYSSNVSLPHGFSDLRTAFVNVSVWGNGGWRNSLNLRSSRACTDTEKMFPTFGKTFFTAAGHNSIKCPIPPGVYEVKDWLVNVRFEAKILPFGRYRIDVSTYENDTRMSCGGREIDVVPKTGQ